MKVLAGLLVFLMAGSAFAAGPWDGLKAGYEDSVVFDNGLGHPPFTSDNRGLATLGLAGWVYAAMRLVDFTAGNEVAGMAWIPVGMVTGVVLETRSAPSKVSMHEYNGHKVKGEGAKWERDPEHPGWNRLVRYASEGPGVDKTHDHGMPFDRIGG